MQILAIRRNLNRKDSEGFGMDKLQSTKEKTKANDKFLVEKYRPSCIKNPPFKIK